MCNRNNNGPRYPNGEAARIINGLPPGFGFDFSTGCGIPPSGYDPHDPNWREKEKLRRQHDNAEFRLMLERERVAAVPLFHRFLGWLAQIEQWIPRKVK